MTVEIKDISQICVILPPLSTESNILGIVLITSNERPMNV